MKSTKKVVIISCLAGIAIVAGISVYLSSRGYETTDNAQLDGDLLPIRAGLSGYVDEIRFKDNQEVRKGDTLICFNTVELQAAISQIQAELESAETNVTVSGHLAAARLESARAASFTTGSEEQSIISAKAAMDRGAQELKRGQQLLDIKAITENSFEQLQTQYDMAKAAYQKALAVKQSSVSSSAGLMKHAAAEQGQVAVAKSGIAEKAAELAAAREKFSHAYIIAPFDGIITKRNVQQGQYITTGQSLCALVNHKELWVTANFKETQLNKIKPGQSVEIKVDAFDGVILKGTIDSYGGATGSRFALIPPDNATGNFIKIAQRFPVRIRIDQLSEKATLYPGLSAFVKVKVD